jgi:hypothetical protein
LSEYAATTGLTCTRECVPFGRALNLRWHGTVELEWIGTIEASLSESRRCNETVDGISHAKEQRYRLYISSWFEYVLSDLTQ